MYFSYNVLGELLLLLYQGSLEEEKYMQTYKLFIREQNYIIRSFGLAESYLTNAVQDAAENSEAVCLVITPGVDCDYNVCCQSQKCDLRCIMSVTKEFLLKIKGFPRSYYSVRFNLSNGITDLDCNEK